MPRCATTCHDVPRGGGVLTPGSIGASFVLLQLGRELLRRRSWNCRRGSREWKCKISKLGKRWGLRGQAFALVEVVCKFKGSRHNAVDICGRMDFFLLSISFCLFNVFHMLITCLSLITYHIYHHQTASQLGSGDLCYKAQVLRSPGCSYIGRLVEICIECRKDRESLCGSAICVQSPKPHYKFKSIAHAECHCHTWDIESFVGSWDQTALSFCSAVRLFFLTTLKGP